MSNVLAAIGLGQIEQIEKNKNKKKEFHSLQEIFK